MRTRTSTPGTQNQIAGFCLSRHRARVALIVAMLGLWRVNTDLAIGAGISARSVAEPSGPLYVGQRFSLSIEVVAEGVTIDSRLGITNMPDRATLEVDRFTERPVERRRSGLQAIEIRRFTAEAVAKQPGALTLAPTLFVRAIRREGFIQYVNDVQLHPDALTLDIIPLPEDGRPSDFTGAVGQFSIAVSISATNAWVNDLLTATVTVTGEGSLPSAIPHLASSKRFAAYPPERTEHIPHRGVSISQSLVALADGTLELPKLSLSYFDPSDGRYHTGTASFPSVQVQSGPRPQDNGGVSSRLRAAGHHAPQWGRSDFAAELPGGLSMILLGAVPLAACALLLCAIAVPRWRSAVPKLLLVLSPILVAVIVKAIFSYRSLSAYVTLETPKEGHFAPDAASRRLVTFPPNIHAKVVERHGEWIRVRSGSVSAWITTNHVTAAVD